MPNWCSTGITFYSRNKEQIQEMLRDFKAIYNGEPTYPNDFGHGWMGDFANKYFVNLGHNEINCRGCVGFIDDEITSRSGYWGFQMSTETAWAPKMGMWQRITEMFYPDVLISYISEECGTGCFTKCDDTGLFYPEDFYIDGCFPSLDGSFDV